MGSLLAIRPGTRPGDEQVLERMAAAAPHRGRVVGTASVGSVRLAATSADGRADGWVAAAPDLAVAFSGTLDNLAELRAAWSPDGAADPAGVAAAGVRREGVAAAAERLRGVFAVAVTDGRHLWAFRDHVGFHPLVYRVGAERVLVAAEPKEIVAGSGHERRPDLDYLTRLYFGARDDSGCAIEGVNRLAAGTVLEAGPGGVRSRRYWAPEARLERGGVGRDEIRHRFRALMKQAVERCLAGDDLVSLSGGVDSPAVAAFAAPIHEARSGTPLAALSAVFPRHPSVDETRYIEAVARELGLRLHTFEPAAGPTDGIDEWVRLFDGPVPHVAFGQVFEFRRVARELGHRNILSGEFQEYVFEMRRHVLPYLVRRGRLLSAVRHARARNARGDSGGKLLRRVFAGFVPARLRPGQRAKRRGRPPGLPDWIEADVVRAIRSDAVPSWRNDQLVPFEGVGLTLSADDTIQNVAGVTERRPFADVDLWEFALGLRAEIKHGDPGPKALVRELLRGSVPDLILDRTDKTVFDSFIRGSLDYDALRRWLRAPPGPPMPGIRYDRLAERIERREMTIPEIVWAKDLASVHAFLAQWEGGG